MSVKSQDSQAYYKNSLIFGAIAPKLVVSLEELIVVVGESLRWAPNKSRHFGPIHIEIATGRKPINSVSVTDGVFVDTLAIEVVEFRDRRVKKQLIN